MYLSVHGTGLCQAAGLVINLGDSWGESGREELRKHRFGMRRDKRIPFGDGSGHESGQGHSRVPLKSGACVFLEKCHSLLDSQR